MLAEHRGDIRRYLQQTHPRPDAPYGIEPQCLETLTLTPTLTLTLTLNPTPTPIPNPQP